MTKRRGRSIRGDRRGAAFRSLRPHTADHLARSCVFMDVPRLAAIFALGLAACTPTAEPSPQRPDPAEAPPEPAQVVAPTAAPPPAIDLDAFDLSPDVERHWLRKDIAVVGRFAALVPLRPLAETLATFEEPCTSIDQGLGIESRTCVVGGGYTRCWIVLVSHDDVVFDADVRCEASERSWSAIGPVISALYATSLVPKGFTVTNNAASLSIRDDAVREHAMARITATLGPRSNADVPATLAESVALLDAPSKRLTIGTACGVGGSPPEGNRAMQALVAAERDDLLRDALRGMNAGGRIYGYIGLRLLGRNTPIDDATYDRLGALDLDVETCGGCRTTTEKSSEIDVTRFRARTRAPG